MLQLRLGKCCGKNSLRIKTRAPRISGRRVIIIVQFFFPRHLFLVRFLFSCRLRAYRIICKKKKITRNETIIRRLRLQLPAVPRRWPVSSKGTPPLQSTTTTTTTIYVHVKLISTRQNPSRKSN